MGWKTEAAWFDYWQTHEIPLQNLQNGFGDDPASKIRTAGSFSGGKFVGGKADHSHSISAEIKNKLSYASTSPYAFMAHTRTTLV